MEKFKDPKKFWILAFVLVNIFAGLVMLFTGELIGDVKGGAVYDYSVLFYATLAVVASYYLILGPFFTFLRKIKINQAAAVLEDGAVKNRIGLFILLFQILYIVFNAVYGVNIAGSSNTKTDSSLAIFWALLPIDALFLIFYGTTRDSKYFKVNAFIYIISNVLRGWVGILLFFIFMEWCRLYREKKINLSKLLLVFCVVLTVYPIISGVKFYIRLKPEGASWVDFFDAIQSIFASADYLDVIYIGFLHIVERLQTVSILVEVIRLRDVLENAFSQGVFIPFWHEGLHGIIFDRLSGLGKGVPFGVAFTAFGDFSWVFDVGDWNINASYPSWFFVAPYLAPVYLVYTLLICFVSMILMKKISTKESAMDMLWVAWLFYLLPPWFGTFVQFIYALFLFLCMKMFFLRLRVVLAK